MKPEIRFDPLKNVRVLIAPGRQSRPIQLNFGDHDRGRDKCPFCEGREAMTPPEIWSLSADPNRQPNTPGWLVRVIPNKYPALMGEEKPRKVCHNTIYESMEGTGYHELVIETPDHDTDLSEHPIDNLTEIFKVYRFRYRELWSKPIVKYVQIFRNWGPLAGASLPHPHTQILAMPFVPEYPMRELHAMKKRPILCEMVDNELREGKRVVRETADFVAFTPFASRFAFETWIVPKEHRVDFGEATDDELKQIADIFKSIIQALKRHMGDFSYNLIIHSMPDKYFHYHIEITPRIAGLAGFEVGTGVNINTVLPEDAAWIIRKNLS
jgi:UDPglucose--hexose-1-phosphate uridylyltransferase